MTPNIQKIQVLIVDDHVGMREGIRAILNAQPDMLVVGEAANEQEAIEQFKSLKPDVSVVDFNLPIICGVDVIKTIRAEFPEARCLIITAVNDDDCIRRALQAGALSYLHKDMLRRELLPAIRAVHAGKSYIPQAIAGKLKAHH